MWTNWNSVVHGADTQESAAIIPQDLQGKIRTLYDEFETKNYLSPTSLFIYTMHG
jgi:hypothetical protein